MADFQLHFTYRSSISIFSNPTMSGIEQHEFDLRCEQGANSTIYLLSKLCVNGSNTDKLECLQNHEDITYMILRKLVAIISILIGLLGVSGNLLTLLAIPYAAKRKR